MLKGKAGRAVGAYLWRWQGRHCPRPRPLCPPPSGGRPQLGRPPSSPARKLRCVTLPSGVSASHAHVHTHFLVHAEHHLGKVIYQILLFREGCL